MRAWITSVRLCTATTGKGQPVFGDEVLSAAIRADGRGLPCEVEDLTTFARGQLEADGIFAERAVKVSRRALTSAGIGDVMKARITIQTVRLAVGTGGEMPEAEVRDVERTREKREGAANVVVLTLSPRRNVPGDGGADGGA